MTDSYPLHHGSNPNPTRTAGSCSVDHIVSLYFYDNTNDTTTGRIRMLHSNDHVTRRSDGPHAKRSATEPPHIFGQAFESEQAADVAVRLCFKIAEELEKQRDSLANIGIDKTNSTGK